MSEMPKRVDVEELRRGAAGWRTPSDEGYEHPMAKLMDAAADEIVSLRKNLATAQELLAQDDGVHNIPSAYFQEGRVIWGVFGTSSIEYVKLLRKKRDEYEAVAIEMAKIERGLGYDLEV